MLVEWVKKILLAKGIRNLVASIGALEFKHIASIIWRIEGDV